MSFASDVEAEVKRIFRAAWTTSKVTNVPTTDSIALEKNDAREIEIATVLYADLKGSTGMVQERRASFAAEVYRAFLYASAQVIRNEGGTITAYDGDRIMAVFVGSSPNTDAAKCALKINYAVLKIVNPAIEAQYTNSYTVKQVVGIDRSSLFIARTGVRGDNDLVFVGRAANYAAKLTEISGDAATFITGDVFDKLLDSSKYGGPQNELMWKQRRWSQMNDLRIYSSTWYWPV